MLSVFKKGCIATLIYDIYRVGNDVYCDMGGGVPPDAIKIEVKGTSGRIIEIDEENAVAYWFVPRGTLQIRLLWLKPSNALEIVRYRSQVI